MIKYYELRNDRVLVLAPKKLRENWSVYTQNDKRNILADDRFNYDVLNHTDLSRTSGFSGSINLATLNWANYDLIVIDESHNFRNNPPVKDRITRYERLMEEIIKSGVKTKVLMLSATPVNNRMNDIKNQIAFITEGKNNAFAAVGGGVFKQADREQSLIGLIRVGLLKRMESSIHSFALTVNKILEKINQTVQLVDDHNRLGQAELDINELDLDDPELDNLIFGNKVKVLLADMDLIKWKQNLLADQDKLETIYLEAINVTPDRDGKLLQLKEQIREKIDNPINPGNQKLLIFTAFADTALYLYQHLAEDLKKQGIYTALVTGSGENQSTLPLSRAIKKNIRMSDLNTVLTLFSPLSKECDKIFPEATQHIDVMIATDCISEGQNLQDCDYLINYDIHWNPVRIIQRFGRIDRIGSHNAAIQLVNFWATRDLDSYINLQQRVRGRMVLLDVSATGEENIIEADEQKEMKDLEYRRKQLKRLQNEVVDLEEISGGISITDLTFNDFKIDLMSYLKENRSTLDEAPNGMYAVVKIADSLCDEIEPGVIFTLRQLKGHAQTKEQNALFPYYLAYVTENGVKLTFIHAKKILDIYKKLCSGNSRVVRELVDAFNLETVDGSSMQPYSELLKKAIENLIGKKQEIGVASLFSKGGTTMQKELFDGIEDFELITFLVLK